VTDLRDDVSQEGRDGSGGSAGSGGLPRLAVPGATLLFALLCLAVFLSFLPAGLWEDGYFFIRYARNTWWHGVMAWNVADGPAHGMTSQLYQYLIAALYPLAPDHLVTVNKLVCAAALAGAAACLFRLRRPEHRSAGDLWLPFLALSLPLVVNHVTTGMETLVVFVWLALWARDYAAFRAGGSRPWRMALYVVVTYLIRPDAVLIPLVALAPSLWGDRARALRALALSAAGLGACLLAFKLYYGTALPLSFYVKSYLATVHSPEHVAQYFHEKVKNGLQFLYFFAPLLLITLVARQRVALALLAAAVAFCAYHALFTVETMGHHSRFYMPAVVPIVAAAVLSWDRFRRRAPVWLPIAAVLLWAGSYAFLKQVDAASRVYIYIRPGFEIPYVAAMALALLPIRRAEGVVAAVAIAIVAAGAGLNYPPRRLEIRDDTAILLRQIAPRKVFLGIVPLRQLDPDNVYHTDMGAPGMLFPRAKVTDLDGLLNEELTLEHRSFDEICRRDRPEAIFLPNKYYRSLRAEMKRSPCFRDYRPVLRRQGSPLHIREDRLEGFQAALPPKLR
jgi:hypothetical protein